MTEEFKKQYDALENIEKAKDLAYNLGYDEAYCEGVHIISPTYSEEMRNKISHLCGNTKWPKNVIDAYSKGDYDGYMDT